MKKPDHLGETIPVCTSRSAGLPQRPSVVKGLWRKTDEGVINLVQGALRMPEHPWAADSGFALWHRLKLEILCL